MKTRTLAILKPDCVKRRLAGEVLSKIQQAGFEILALKMARLTRDTAEGFYEVHKGKPFFESLMNYMTGGPCIPMVIEKENAVEDYRALMGATDPQKAAEGTIRKLFAESMTCNIVHGSDSEENAEKEISFFFSKQEIIENIS